MQAMIARMVPRSMLLDPLATLCYLPAGWSDHGPCFRFDLGAYQKRVSRARAARPRGTA